MDLGLNGFRNLFTSLGQKNLSPIYLWLLRFIYHYYIHDRYF